MNQKPRLLIVEDNPADADLIQEMLPQAGPLNFQVEPVARLSEALARLGRKDVDLVLLDLGLPDSQGLPTFHALRQAAPEIPVIVLTGNDDQELAIAAVRDGAQDYLVKGQFSGGQLIRAIRYALARRQAEEALRQSELKFRTLVEHIPQKVFIKDRESRYLSANENYARDLGIKPEEIAGRMDYDFYPKPLAEKYRADDRRIMRNGEAEEFDEKYLQEGREVWIHTAKTPVRNEAGEVTGILGIFWDISERKRAEIELQRVNRALRLISLCNQEMVRATDEAALLQAVCRIVVEQGGFRMAWVGFAEQDEAKSVRPASHFGVEEGYLDTLNVTWADAQRGRGPTGTAIRTGKPVYARNLSTNPAFGPWRGPAMERGYASSIALPLMDEGRCIGALTLYAGEPDAFDPGEIELLTEMANDLAFGIGALRHRAEGRRAEAAVQASEARFRTLIERSPVAIGISRGGKTIYANQKYLNLFGFQSIDELVRQPIADQWAPEYREMIMERARRRARGEPVPSEYEAIGQRKDGSQFAAHISVSLVELPDGTASMGFLTDITGRKKAEDALRASETLLRESQIVADLGSYVLDIPAGLWRGSDVLDKVFGIDKTYERSVEGWTRLTHPDDRAMMADYLRNEVIGRRQPFDKEYRIIRHNDQAERWVHGMGRLEFDDEGRPVKMLGTIQDITERKQVERDREQAFLRQQGISRLHESLLERRPLRDKLQLVTETIVRLFDADFCRIWLTRPGDLCAQGCMHALTTEGPHVCRRREMCLHLLASAGRYTHLDGAGHRRVPYGAYKIGRIAAQQEAKFLVNDVLQEPLVHDHEWAKKLGLVSFAGYRLQSPGGAPLGVLALFAKRPLTAQEDALLEGLSDAVTSVLLTQLAEDGTRRELAERKRAEEAVRESERRFQTLAISSPVGIFQTDAQGRTIYVNPRWCEIAGLSAADALGDGWLRAVHPDDREKIAQGWRAATHEQGTSKTDYRFVRPDGTIVWVMGQAVPEKDDAGRIVGYVGTIADITERKLAGMVLLNSEVRYRRLFEAAKDGILILDAATGKVMDVNPFLTGLLGFSHQEFLGKTIWELGFFKHIVANQARFEEFQKKEHIRHDDLPLETGDGRRIHVEFVSNVYQVDQHKVIQCNIRDITERKRVQMALEESRMMLRSVLDTIPVRVFWKDAEGRYLGCNQPFARDAGFDRPEQLTGKNDHDMAWKEQADLYVADDRRVMASGVPKLQYEEPQTTPAGTRLWLRTSKIPLRDAEDRIIGILGTYEDITEHRKALEQFQRLANEQRTILHTASVGICFVRNRKLEWVNPAFIAMSGYEPPELQGADTALIYARPEDYQAIGREGYAQFAKGAIYRNEMQMRRKDGRLLWCEIAGQAINSKNLDEGSIWSLLDITERKRAEAALRDSEAFLNTVIEKIPHMIFVKDAKELRFVKFNQAGQELLGYSLADLVGKNDYDLFPKEMADYFTEKDRKVLEGRAVVDIPEEPIQTRGQGERILHTKKIPVFDNAGQLVFLLGISNDITERKRMEAALIRERDLWRTLLDNSPDKIYFKDTQSRFVKCSRAMAAQFGLKSPDELVGKTDFDIFDESHARPAFEDEQEIIRTGRPMIDREEREESKDGRVTWVTSTKLPWLDDAGKIVGTMGISRDITGRKLVEAELNRERDLWRVLLETSLDNIYFKDIHSRFIKCSKAQARFFGVESPDELVGRTDFDFCAEADARARFEDEQKIIRTGEPIIAKEEREERKAGQVVWMSSTKMPLRDAAGKIIGIMGVSRDITGRKLVEQQVKEALDFNRTIILDAAVGITAFKASGHCILANDTAAKILNGTVPRLLAMDFRKLVSWRASGMLPIAEEVLATKTSRQCDVNFVSSFGKEVWLVSHLSHFVQNGEPHLLHVFSDVTERKKLETQFLRAQRMESIGTLAGGIAHDLNNVLTPLLFSVQILKEKISDDEGQQILDSLEANVKRGASLVKQVLAFGRGVKGDRILLQVRNLAREIEGIVQETFPKSVRFQLDAATGLWTVSCDPTQIHQVLLNLCVNARDAMPGGGKLSLRLNNVTLDTAHAAAHLDARPGPYVVISVEDTGMGISRDNQERIFEPFFTTKELGKGTGLGLSTTLAIVKSHGGFITCNSEPGKGTIFKVYLPASAEAAAEAGVPEEQSQLPRGNDELVLVVDDEAPIREMAQHILERYGYRVVLAVNGFDAVQLYTTRQDEIATVLTDMAMPVMDGPATIAALQSVNPKVKIVGFSGLEMKGAEAEAFRLGCGRFVSKPFTAETLLQVLRAILHEPAGERSTDNKPKTKKKRG